MLRGTVASLVREEVRKQSPESEVGVVTLFSPNVSVAEARGPKSYQRLEIQYPVLARRSHLFQPADLALLSVIILLDPYFALCRQTPDCCPILVIRSARTAEAWLFVLEATLSCAIGIVSN